MTRKTIRYFLPSDSASGVYGTLTRIVLVCSLVGTSLQSSFASEMKTRIESRTTHSSNWVTASGVERATELNPEIARWLELNPDVSRLVLESEELGNPFDLPILTPAKKLMSDREFLLQLTEPDRIRRRTVGAAASAQSTAARQIYAAAERFGLVTGNGQGCEQWVGQFGFGPFAKVLFDELRGRDSSKSRSVRVSERRSLYFDGPQDLVSENVCPAYPKLDDEHKEAIWAGVFMWASFKESSCNPNVYNPGAPNGVARGLFQLHDGKEAAYGVRGRSDCRNGDSRDPMGSIRCAVGVLEAQFLKQNQTLFSNQSYYGVLRPRGDLVTLKNGEKKRVVIYKALIEYLRGLPMCQSGMPARIRHAAN